MRGTRRCRYRRTSGPACTRRSTTDDAWLRERVFGGGAKTEGADQVVAAGDQGDGYGGGHEEDRCPVQEGEGLPWEEVEAEGDGLQNRFEFAAAAGGHHAVADDPEAEGGDAPFADHDDDRDPPRELAEQGEADEGRPGEGLVGDRIGDLAEVRDQVPAAGDVTLETVGDDRDDERGGGEQAGAGRGA